MDKDPLSQWKSSPIDKTAQKHWKDYSRLRPPDPEIVFPYSAATLEAGLIAP